MSANQPPSDLPTRVRLLLSPFVTTPEDREALITEAFFLHDPLLSCIKLNGSSKVFCVRLINQLWQHGCITPDQHALARLLTTVRHDCGVDKYPEIDELIDLTNDYCEPEPPADPPPPVPVAPTVPAGDVQTIAIPQADRTPTVFISYSHDDTGFANQLIADLNAAGHACWIDTSDIKGGDEWIMTIAEGIINSYAFVAVVTHKALMSRWVQDEILWAKNKNKRIIPVLLENVLHETRFFPLVSYQAVTVFDSDYTTVLPKLLSYLPNPTLPAIEISPDEADDETPIVETPRAVLTASTPVERRKLELAYLERLKLEELLNTEKYTAMGGVAQVNNPEMRAVFELLPMGRDREQPQETRRFENAVEEIRAIRRCVLLGEPGGGKTTTIWKLAADLVETALTDPKASIPILIRLGKWTDADQLLSKFIASQLGDLGAYLDTLLSERRAALLLDGLNELPASQQKTKYPQVQHFVEQHPDLLAVVSCRELDYTIDLSFDKIYITPLDPPRVREFTRRYLGSEKGDDLFWKLAGVSAHSQYTSFVNEVGARLDDPEQTFWNATVLPPRVHWGYRQKRDNTFWDKWLLEREQPSSLMLLARNPYMLLMLTSVYADEGDLPANRSQLFVKFIETLLEREAVPNLDRALLMKGLAKVAYEMQLQRIAADQGASGDGRSVVTVLPRNDVKAILGEQMLYRAGSTSILTVGEPVRFTHQLLQEYFAAIHMDTEIKAGRLKATDIWWTSSEWWERTNWEEATILLAGLYSDNPTPIVEWLMNAQPEIAAQCITRSGANAPPDETLVKLRAAWIPRLTDISNEPSPEARAAIGRAIGQLRLRDDTPLDNRKGVSVVVRNGKSVPDIAWCYVPPGSVQMGGDPEAQRPWDGIVIELPYSFWLAKYPVTYGQYEAFVRDAGYANDTYWTESGQDWRGTKSYPEVNWNDTKWHIANHPVIGVTWYEAVAYCRWMTEQLRGIQLTASGGKSGATIGEQIVIRLPIEAEWEKAARYPDGRKYPWGENYISGHANIVEIPTAGDVNNKASFVNRTTAVGLYPQGANPEHGAHDQSGNVWEWCLSRWKDNYAYPEDNHLDGNHARVLRGGSWSYVAQFARCATRRKGDPDVWFDFRGFRVVAAPPIT